MGVKAVIAASVFAVVTATVVVLAEAPKSAAPVAAARQSESKPVATTQPDLSTPLGTMRAFNDALNRADTSTLDRICYAPEDGDKSMLTAMEDVMRTMAELKKVATEKFGEKAVGDAHSLAMGGRAGDVLDNAEVQINGDHAQVTFPKVKRSEPFELVKVDKEWKVSIAELLAPHDQTPQRVQHFLDEMHHQKKALADTLADLRTGDVTSIDDLKIALAAHARER